MKNKKLLLSVIIMCLILALCSGCAPKGGEEENGHEENGQEEVSKNGEVYIIYIRVRRSHTDPQYAGSGRVYHDPGR